MTAKAQYRMPTEARPANPFMRPRHTPPIDPGPRDRAMERVAGRHVAGVGHRCLACERFVAQAGGCPGCVPSQRDATPICHVDFLTGRFETAFPEGLGRRPRRRASA